jgi:hypothetical protein
LYGNEIHFRRVKFDSADIVEQGPIPTNHFGGIRNADNKSGRVITSQSHNAVSLRHKIQCNMIPVDQPGSDRIKGSLAENL